MIRATLSDITAGSILVFLAGFSIGMLLAAATRRRNVHFRLRTKTGVVNIPVQPGYYLEVQIPDGHLAGLTYSIGRPAASPAELVSDFRTPRNDSDG
jgi:hypothetical protein